MTRIAFTVPGKPRGKGRPRVPFGGGRPFTPAATRAAEKEIAKLAMIARGSAPLITGTVRLTIEAVFRIPTSWSRRLREAAIAGEVAYTGKPDADNIAKLADALNEVLWLDDSQVASVIVTRRYGTPERTEFLVEEIEAPEGLKSPAERAREKKLARGIVSPKRSQKAPKRAPEASTLHAIGKRIR